jgi:hypothetical protein
MANPPTSYSQSALLRGGRFGAGLSEEEVRRFQAVLQRDFGLDLSLPEAWSGAITLLSLVEMLLGTQGALLPSGELSTKFASPRT